MSLLKDKNFLIGGILGLITTIIVANTTSVMNHLPKPTIENIQNKG